MPRRKRSKKWLKWVIILVLIAAAGVVWYFVWDGYFREKPKEDAGGQDDSSIVTPSDDEEKKNEEPVVAPTEPDKKAEQYDGEDPNKSDEITGVVTYAEVAGRYLTIGVNIDQYLSGGTCKISLLKNGDGIYYNTVNVVDLVSTSSCDGFDVPLNDTMSGNIQIVINVKSGDKAGTISGEVTL